MFTVGVQYLGADVPTEVTVYDNLRTDEAVLTDLYSALVDDTDGNMGCETCDRLVLRVERGVMGTLVVTEFHPFGTDEEDSGTILCAPCILKSAHYGTANLGAVDQADGAGRHRASL